MEMNLGFQGPIVFDFGTIVKVKLKNAIIKAHKKYLTSFRKCEKNSVSDLIKKFAP